MGEYILAIDQGTTSSRAIVFNKDQSIAGVSQKEFTQHFPKSGWVEHDLEDIWEGVVEVCHTAMKNAKIDASDIAAIGITNQRETVAMWDKKTGKPVHKAIVWQDRRTADMCDDLKKAGHEQTFTKKTGLLLDPYFSATKVAWMLDHVRGLRKKAENGSVLFGTIDSFLIWRLTGGDRHVTDATNAARTMMFNIRTHKWDAKLLEILNIPAAILPEVLDCQADFGTAHADILGADIPIYGVAGDQQAATIGQACFEPGMFKSTYGTGCFALLNTGTDAVTSKNRLLTTIAYQIFDDIAYGLEGSIFVVVSRRKCHPDLRQNP